MNDEAFAVQSISHEAGVTRLRGGVKLTLGDATVTADEVDISERTGVADLRGNVRIFLPGSEPAQ